MLENKRYVERFPSDLKVRFGEHTFSDNGRVQDVSMFGFFIKTSEVFPIGTSLKVQLLTPEKLLIKIQGIVQWSVDEKESRHGDKENGMGIEISSFLEGRDSYKRLCQEFWKKDHL